MADQLATPESLASLLQQSLDATTANLVLQVVTAVVQEAAGNQRLVQVVDEEIELLGTTESWLWLPQRPVTAVISITLDGETIDVDSVAGSGGYRRFGARLWRCEGWQTYLYVPSTVGVIYTHGYPTGHQDLELARGATLSISRAMYDNPSSVAREAIDDYSVAYARAAGEAADQMEAAPGLRAALQRKYGRRVGLARLGGS